MRINVLLEGPISNQISEKQTLFTEATLALQYATRCINEYINSSDFDADGNFMNKQRIKEMLDHIRQIP